MGLCFAKKQMTFHRGNGLVQLSLEGQIVGGILDFLGLWMLVIPDSVAKPAIQEEGTCAAPIPIISRPNSLMFTNPRGGWEVLLDWGTYGSGTRISYEALALTREKT